MKAERDVELGAPTYKENQKGSRIVESCLEHCP